jgi:poly-gamma-glutamate capsule biosynthesis protein CapA/YwtB (metallophosphatase superfamily)
MDDIRVIKQPISLDVAKDLAKQRFGDMVKVVVDLEKEIMAIGGELHADEEAVLLDLGSKQEQLWGANIYVEEPRAEWIEFDSMINIRPSQNNKSRTVEDPSIKERITIVINKLIK